MYDEDVSEKEVPDLKTDEEKDGGRDQARRLRTLTSFNAPFSAAGFKRING